METYFAELELMLVANATSLAIEHSVEQAQRDYQQAQDDYAFACYLDEQQNEYEAELYWHNYFNSWQFA